MPGFRWQHSDMIFKGLWQHSIWAFGISEITGLSDFLQYNSSFSDWSRSSNLFINQLVTCTVFKYQLNLLEIENTSAQGEWDIFYNWCAKILYKVMSKRVAVYTARKWIEYRTCAVVSLCVWQLHSKTGVWLPNKQWNSTLLNTKWQKFRDRRIWKRSSGMRTRVR